MKTIRVYLTICAIVISIGGAIGSSFISTEEMVYQWIDEPGIEDDICMPLDLPGCSQNGLFPCKCLLGSVVYRANMTESTQCGSALWKDLLPICVAPPQ